MWRPEDILRELVLYFHHVRRGDQIQVTRLWQVSLAPGLLPGLIFAFFPFQKIYRDYMQHSQQLKKIFKNNTKLYLK